MRAEDVEPLTELVIAVGEDLDRRRGRADRAAARHGDGAQPLPPPVPAPTPRAPGSPRTSTASPPARWPCGATTCGSCPSSRSGPTSSPQGVGRAILERCHDYADGAKGRLIATSQDPRALRAYARLGLDAHPCFKATGTPQRRRRAAPASARATRRHPVHRGTSTATSAAPPTRPDIAAPAGQRPAPARLRARLRDRRRRATCACSPPTTRPPRATCCAPCSPAAARLTVRWITGRQQWAIEACLAARPGPEHRTSARCSSAATSARSIPTCRAGPTCDPPADRGRRPGALRADVRGVRALRARAPPAGVPARRTPRSRYIRPRHLIRTDPGGAWGAEQRRPAGRVRARARARGRVGPLAARHATPSTSRAASGPRS